MATNRSKNLQHLPLVQSVQTRRIIFLQLAAVLHLHLHGATSLERRPTPNDQRQVMRTELGIIVRGVGIRVPGACQDRAALDARLQALLAEGHPFELGQAVPFGGAIQQRVLEQHLAGAGMKHGRLGRPSTAVGGGHVLEFPRVPPFVVDQPGVVIPFVEKLEHGGEDLRKLVGQVDPFGPRLKELPPTEGGEERRGG